MLQEGLKEVKLRHGNRIHLRKTAGAPSSPFPVLVSIHIEQDRPEYAQFDQLEGLKVVVTISNAILNDSVKRISDVAILHVAAPQLPLFLRIKMQHTICGKFMDARADQPHAVACTVMAVASLAAGLQSLIPDLLTLVPTAMEQYVSIGVNGDSERRMKFSDVEEQVVKSHGPPDIPNSHVRCDEGRADEDIANLPCTEAGIPDVIAQAAKALASRYPDLLPMPVDAEHGRGTPSAIPFTVSVLPSHPTWEHGRLRLSGKVAVLPGVRTDSSPLDSSMQVFGVEHSSFCESHGQAPSGAPGCQDILQPRPPALMPQVQGMGMAVTLKLTPSELTDAATCAMVNQNLKTQARLRAGALFASFVLVSEIEAQSADSIQRPQGKLMLSGACSSTLKLIWQI